MIRRAVAGILHHQDTSDDQCIICRHHRSAHAVLQRRTTRVLRTPCLYPGCTCPAHTREEDTGS